MDREQIKGGWNEIKGKIKQKWGQLTDDEIAQSEGKQDELVGKIQRRYGGAKEEIRRELDDLMR